MAKKLLLLVISIFILKTSSFGQAACTPDPTYSVTTSRKGIHPDTLINMAPAYVGVPYSQTLTLVIPPDTTVGIPFVWDSTVALNFTGMPSSLTYACWNNNGIPAKQSRCSWKGNSIGCLAITGTPTAGEVGTHKIFVNINNYIAGSTTPNPYTVKGYKIIVNPAGAVNENEDVITLQQNNPNPFNDKTKITFSAESTGTAELKVYNMIGAVVYKTSVKAERGLNYVELNAKSFEPGIYFYSLIHGNNAITRKMVVEK